MNQKKTIKPKKTRKEGKFPCPFCDHVPFLNPQALNIHIRWKHHDGVLGDAVATAKEAPVPDTESIKTLEQEATSVTKALEQETVSTTKLPVKPVVAEEKVTAPTKGPEPVAPPPDADFDMSMVDPLVRQSGFAKEVSSELGGLKNNIKDMATAIAGMANEMGKHAAVFQQLDTYLKQLQGTAGNPETASAEMPNPEAIAPEVPNPEVAATVAAQQQTQAPLPGAFVGSSYIPLIDRILQAMNIAKSAPAQNSPQDNFVKQFTDALGLVSTMRKATIDEMQVTFASMASFFKNAPKFLGTGESEKIATEPAKPIAHLED